MQEMNLRFPIRFEGGFNRSDLGRREQARTIAKDSRIFQKTRLRLCSDF
jgi:hypothetical protein